MFRQSFDTCKIMQNMSVHRPHPNLFNKNNDRKAGRTAGRLVYDHRTEDVPISRLVSLVMRRHYQVKDDFLQELIACLFEKENLHQSFVEEYPMISHVSASCKRIWISWLPLASHHFPSQPSGIGEPTHSAARSTCDPHQRGRDSLEQLKSAWARLTSMAQTTNAGHVLT